MVSGGLEADQGEGEARGCSSPRERHPGCGHPGCSVTVRTPEAMHILFRSGRFLPRLVRGGWRAAPEEGECIANIHTAVRKTGSH